jgi:nucleotide-binding universal stress UspA family protein
MGSDSDLGRLAISARSTATRVLRASQVPVLLHPQGSETVGPIAVAIGPREDDDPADLLNRKLLRIGASLARSLGRNLHVVHAWRIDGESVLRGSRLDYDTDDNARQAREAQLAARMRADELLADVGVADLEVRVHVEKGHAGDVLSSLSGGLNPGVLIVGTVARQGLQGVVVGNTVERVARRSRSPVLAVKPDGFFDPRVTVEEWTPTALPY